MRNISFGSRRDLLEQERRKAERRIRTYMTSMAMSGYRTFYYLRHVKKDDVYKDKNGNELNTGGLVCEINTPWGSILVAELSNGKWNRVDWTEEQLLHVIKATLKRREEHKAKQKE